MSLFAIADLHLSFSADKPMDIFKGWSDYVQRIENNWRKMIEPDDTVVIAGDVSWAIKLAETEADFRFIHNLPGQKIILKGNHDLWWSTLTKMNAFLADKGFDSIRFLHNNAWPVEEFCVCGSRGWFFDAEETGSKVLLREAGRLETSIGLARETGLEPVVFLHYPPVWGGMVCSEIMDVLVRNGIKRCYYGHIHGKKAFKIVRGCHSGIKFELISSDFTGFCPVKILPAAAAASQ